MNRMSRIKSSVILALAFAATCGSVALAGHPNPPGAGVVEQLDGGRQYILSCEGGGIAWDGGLMVCGPAGGGGTGAGPAGPTGPQGDAGVQGPQGNTGPAGATGDAGPMGLIGNPGPTGTQGPTGAQGDAGATGPMGLIGNPGPTGAQGDAGAAGAQGPTGAGGDAGLNGATGSQGATGSNGATGPQGDAGVNGAAGATGSAGATGPQGDAGTNGTIGPTGPTGPAGDAGTNGATGPAGAGLSGLVTNEVLYGLSDGGVGQGNLSYDAGSQSLTIGSVDGGAGVTLTANTVPTVSLAGASTDFVALGGTPGAVAGNTATTGLIRLTGAVGTTIVNAKYATTDIPLWTLQTFNQHTFGNPGLALILNGASYTFGSNVAISTSATNFQFIQASAATGSFSLVPAQSSTANGTGFPLLLNGGIVNGSGLKGPVRIAVGGTTSNYLLDATEMTTGQRVLCLLMGTACTATQLPSGAGDRVMFIANDAADPSVNAVGGGYLYVSGGALKWRGSSGTVTTIAAP